MGNVMQPFSLHKRGFLSFVACALFISEANASIAARISKVLKAIGKPALAITTSALAGVVSAKVMKDLEKAHDDSPMLLVATYYTLIDTKRFEDAASCWESVPDAHMRFMKTVEDLVLKDVKELNRTPARAHLLVVLQAKQFGRSSEEWRGTVEMGWHETHWLIRGMQIKKTTVES
jgi:hypothetical protein